MPKESYHWRRVVAEVLPRLAYRINIPPEAKTEINKIADLLNQRPNLSFVAYFNHVSSSDPFLIAHVVEKFDSKHSRHLVAPVSYSYLDPEQPKNRGYELMVKIATSCDVEMIKVVQSYQIDDQKHGYTRDFANEINQKWSQRIEELGQSNQPVGCLISPEGHRSDTGILGRARGGIVSAGSKLTPVVYIPIGIVFNEEFNRSGLNLNKRVTLNVGQTIIQENPEQPPTLEQLISNLAQTLPESLRGKVE